MPFNIAMLDLVSPYVVRGENLGANHAALAAIRVVTFETATSPTGVVIRGQCQFNGWARIDISQGRLDTATGVNESAPPFDPTRRSPVFDLQETTLDFELVVPRQGSAIIAEGEDIVADRIDDEAAVAFGQIQDVLEVWQEQPGVGLSDYPASGFRLDLILNAPTVRPPFLHPAQMLDTGLLVPDPSYQEVVIQLPKLRFRFSHGSAIGSRLSFGLVSAGVVGLDDPGHLGVAELVSMEPPYAFVGRARDRTVGFGFRKAVLDLAEGYTPPAITSKFGFGDDWGGLYLPEARFFLAPEGAKDFAFEAGVEDLLIGFGDDAGVSGDFELALINQGSGELQLSARFFDAAGQVYGLEQIRADSAIAILPEQTRMVVDIQGGLAPYTTEVQIDGGVENSRLVDVDLNGEASTTISITVTDASPNGSLEATLTITARRLIPVTTLPTPGDTPSPTYPVTLTTVPGAPFNIVIASQTDQTVTLTTDPADSSLVWRVNGGTASSPRATFTVDLATGDPVTTVQATRPLHEVPNVIDYFFFFGEPPETLPSNEYADLYDYGTTVRSSGRNVSTARATSDQPGAGREGNDRDPIDAYDLYFQLLAPFTELTIVGEASYEGDSSKFDDNYLLARRRAIAVQGLLQAEYGGNFDLRIDPEPENYEDYSDLNDWIVNWESHGDNNPVAERRDWWKASIALPPGLSIPEQQAEATLERPTAPPPPLIIPVVDPPPLNSPQPPAWLHSAKLKVRLVRNVLIAGELEAEVNLQTLTEDQLANSGELQGSAPQVDVLQGGTVDNAADGITKLRLLVQADQATGQMTTLIALGADPADQDGLALASRLPEDPVHQAENFGLNLLGSYLSFWPLLTVAAESNQGTVTDYALTGAAITIPGLIANLPWFAVERVILYGGEFLQRDRNGEVEAFLLVDVQIEWSADIAIGNGPPLISIPAENPLKLRYKTIGLRFGSRDDASDQFSLRPVFDSSRGYTLDIPSGSGLEVREPLGRILRVLAARLSRTNPLTFEVDLGLAVDLGVVSFDQARLRVYLPTQEGDGLRSPELTALGAGVDIPGALVGRGYLEIGDDGIAGQIDLIIRPINLRVAAVISIQNIAEAEGGPATAVYVSINLVLPVGLPLGASGLGIFGFRGIFGMHYQRNLALGDGSAAPSLEWLIASQGQPHELIGPGGEHLWIPQINQWAFGLGILIGTMEGGVLMNLDGTFLLELPGPRIVIVLNARILSPPPSLDVMGTSGGLLAIIEITPDHFLIGMVATYGVERLVTIRVPMEALFSFGDPSDWHIYLGQRPADYGDPVEVNVLGLVRGTGYLMLLGNGLNPLELSNGETLPGVDNAFAIAIGAAAALRWGGSRLYLRLGGSLDAVLGFSPFLLGGLFLLDGELRLFIISIGASVSLKVLVREVDSDDSALSLFIKGEACGRLDLFFFKIKGCVAIEIGSETDPLPPPNLVQKLSLKGRSPALVLGTAVDRPVDGSLGESLESEDEPTGADLNALPVVPIDSIPVLSMVMPPVATGLTFRGEPVPALSGVPADGYVSRGEEQYRYELTSVNLTRVDPSGSPLIGSSTPATWWTLKAATEPNETVQLALLTWEPTPASKAIEKSESLKESIRCRWGTLCQEAAPPTPVLWTFQYERLGISFTGWTLEGIALPDPPETRRSTEPDTTLRVTERWRSRDSQVDSWRGIPAAHVVGAVFSCPPSPGVGQRSGATSSPAESPPILVVGGRGTIGTMSSPLSGRRVALTDPVFNRLVRSGPVTPFRITPRLYDKVARVEAIAPQPNLQNLNQRGRTIPRSDLLQATQVVTSSQPSPLAAEAELQCEARVLAAPLFDDGRTIVFGDPDRSGEIEAALEASGVTHGPLDNVVVLEVGLFERTTLLVLVRRFPYLIQERFVVRTLDAEGNELDRVVATVNDQIGPPPSFKALPAPWTDPASPWRTAIAHLQTFLSDLPGVAILLTIDGQEADRIELGVLPGADPPSFDPPYHVAAIESLRLQEADRHAWDASQINQERQVITSILGQESTDHALLYPDSLYQVSATWTGVRRSDEEDKENPENLEPPSTTQRFWFRTDAEAPRRLDPWVMMTLPSDGETAVFGGEPLRLVFNTHDVDRLYDAYGKELRIRLQAASAHHPVSQPGGTHPFPINPMTLELISAGILSPWEDLLQEVIAEDGPCIPINEDRTRHSAVTVPLPLDPFTGYILDVVMVDIGAPEDEPGISVYRRHFETGAFTTVEQFGASLQGVRDSARAVPLGSMAQVLATFSSRDPEGSELDEALRSRGLEAMPAPDRPRITTFWEQADADSPPQPTAVLVDASEPLWRSRPYPTPVVDNSVDPPSERYEYRPQAWLQLETSPGSPPMMPSRIIRAPGLQRALVILPPNSRGQRLQLDLVALAFTEPYLNLPERRLTVVDITFEKAPWEA